MGLIKEIIIRDILITIILGAVLTVCIGHYLPKKLNPHPDVKISCNKYEKGIKIGIINTGKGSAKNPFLHILSTSIGCSMALSGVDSYLWNTIGSIWSPIPKEVSNETGYFTETLLKRDFIQPVMEDYQYLWFPCPKKTKFKIELWGENLKPIRLID